MLLVLLFFTVLYVIQSFQMCLLVVTAEQLQGYFVLLRQGPGSNHHKGALKMIEVVAFDHLNSSRTTHGSIDLIEDSNFTFIACSVGGGLHIHIKDMVA